MVLALLIGVASAATAPAQTQPTLGVLVDQVVALFPKVDGDVIEVQGSTVTVAIGQKDGLLAGVELALYREGRELRHPKTGEVLGRTEQAVGRMVVQQVFEAYATGSLSQPGDVQAGDKARVSAGKVKLSVLPIAEGPGVKGGLVEAAVHELVEGLNRTGRFQVGMGDAIGVWLTQQGIKRDDVLAGKGLAQVAARFKVEQLLVVAFTRVQNKPYMDVRLFTLPAVNPLLTTALFVPPAIKAAPKGDFSAGRPRESQSPNPQRSLLARLLFGDLDAGTYSSGEAAIPLKEVAKFPFVVTSMDIAVGSKDRTPRMVVTDGERIYLYRISPERVLEAEWTYRGDSRGRIFSVQLAELAEEGVVHVVANRYNPIPAILLNSFILTSKDKKPVMVVEDVPDNLLAVDTSGEGVKKTLWVQSFAQNGFFKQGDAQRAALRNGRLVMEQRVRVPSSFRATGATGTNITGKGPRALAYVDEHSRLRIAIDTEEVFRSATQVGGGLVKLVVQTQNERGGRDYIYTTEPMPLSVDLDGDGIDEIVVPQNQFPGRLAVVYKGPAGYRFQTVNSGFEGTVIALGAVPGDSGTPSLVAAVVRYTNVFSTQGETQIIMTLVE